VKIIASLVFGAFLVSCSGKKVMKKEKIDGQFLKNYLTKSYPHSVNKCYNGLVGYFKDHKIPLKGYNRAKMVVLTHKYPVIKHKPEHRDVASADKTFHKYRFTLSGDDKNCTITATNYWYWQDDKPVNELHTSWGKEAVWDPFFSGVQAKIEGK
jgi:hypothetical protein